MKELFERLVEYITEVRNKYPEVKNENLDNNGKIVYANGNDGTDFDWEYNDRLCEFMIFHNKEKDYLSFLKVYVYKCGTVTIYTYPNGEFTCVDKFSKDLFVEDEVDDMKEYLLSTSDDECRWNCLLEELL